MYIKLNEEFEMFGNKLKCIEGDGLQCKGCVGVLDVDLCSYLGVCNSRNREDNKNVIYVEVN